MKSSLKDHFPVVLFFAAVSCIHTWPLIFKMSESIFGDPQWLFDSLGSLYGMWWEKTAFINGYDVNHNFLIAYPFGLDTSQVTSQPVFTYPLLFFSVLKDEIFSYNFFILLSFILSGFFAYLLVFYLTRAKWPSLIAGFIYAFSPNHSLQAFSHFGQAQIQWLPLYVLSLCALYERRNRKTAFFWALSFFLVMTMNYYFGYFAVLFTSFFVFFLLFYPRKKQRIFLPERERGKTAKAVVLALAFSLIFILPTTHKVIWGGLRPANPEKTVATLYQQPYDDLFRYSARIYDYFLPSEYHPVFGSLTKKIVGRITGRGRHWSERTLFLGFIPLIFVLMTLEWRFWRKKRSQDIDRDGFYVWFFLGGAVFSFICSLSPLIQIGPVKIPTPSFFLYRLAPMFRVYARMGFLVNLCVAVLAAYSLKEITTRIRNKKNLAIFIAGLLFLIAFEYTVIPPFRTVDLKTVPPVYEWLRKQNPDTVIAEYPFYDFLQEEHYRYLFYQRVHRKRMVNGAPKGSSGDVLRREAGNILSPQSRSILKDWGVDLLILHKKSYGGDDLRLLDEAEDLAEMADFPEAKVYRLAADL